jgi:hypothetical protein
MWSIGFISPLQCCIRLLYAQQGLFHDGHIRETALTLLTGLCVVDTHIRGSYSVTGLTPDRIVLSLYTSTMRRQTPHTDQQAAACKCAACVCKIKKLLLQTTFCSAIQHIRSNAMAQNRSHGTWNLTPTRPPLFCRWISLNHVAFTSHHPYCHDSPPVYFTPQAPGPWGDARNTACLYTSSYSRIVNLLLKPRPLSCLVRSNESPRPRAN